MKSVQQGFTLIELLVVIAIIGILAAVAVPQYSAYVDRSEAAAAYSQANAYRTIVEAAIFDRENPEDLDGLPDTLAIVGEWDDDPITITYTAPNTNDDRTLVLSRDEDGVWTCKSGFNNTRINCEDD